MLGTGRVASAFKSIRLLYPISTTFNFGKAGRTFLRSFHVMAVRLSCSSVRVENAGEDSDESTKADKRFRLIE